MIGELVINYYRVRNADTGEMRVTAFQGVGIYPSKPESWTPRVVHFPVTPSRHLRAMTYQTR